MVPFLEVAALSLGFCSSGATAIAIQKVVVAVAPLLQ